MDIVSFESHGIISDWVEHHNLGVTPEFMIFKARQDSSDWWTYHKDIGFTKWLYLNKTNATADAGSVIFATTNNTFGLNSSGIGFGSFKQVITYLFATCPGISKVGSYTGNGTSQVIDCGFSTGARFILIKRTDSTGDWYIWDSTRGIIAANDPHLSLNTTSAEVTTDDSVDPNPIGFIVNQVAATNINVLNATYIFLSIA